MTSENTGTGLRVFFICFSQLYCSHSHYI